MWFLLNECSLVLEPLLVVEEQVALAVQHLLDGRGHDLVVVAPVPAVPVGREVFNSLSLSIPVK